MSKRLMDKDGFDVQDFLLEVQMGHIPGAELIWKFGYSGVNTAGVPNTIQDGVTGLYTYYLGYGVNAKALDLVSTNPVDNGLEFYIEGLDADGYPQSEYITIGSTSTKIYSRFFRAWNNNGTASIGDVHLYVTSTLNIVGHIHQLSQSTLMSIYTIPKGKVGYLNKGIISVGGGKEVVMDNMIRKLGGVFSIRERVILYQSPLEANRPFIPIPELSDIEIRVTPVQLNTAVSASFGVLLLDKEKFDL